VCRWIEDTNPKVIDGPLDQIAHGWSAAGKFISSTRICILGPKSMRRSANIDSQNGDDAEIRHQLARGDELRRGEAGEYPNAQES